jgi:hypothetical protein
MKSILTNYRRIAYRHGTLLLAPPHAAGAAGVYPPGGADTLLNKQDGGTTVNN